MYSSLETVIEWVNAEFDLPVSTYPQADVERPFVVVNRTGGTCSYPHDTPRFGVQFWTDADSDGEDYAMELAKALPDITDASERINAVGEPDITQIGATEGGAFIWEVGFSLATNIYE